MGIEKFTQGEWKAVISAPLEDGHICDVSVLKAEVEELRYTMEKAKVLVDQERKD